MTATTHAKQRARQRYGIILDASTVARIDKQVPRRRIRPGMKGKPLVERVVWVHGRAMRTIINRYERVIVTVLPEVAPLFFK